VTADVFVSYAPEDTPLCRELEKHLAGLVRAGVIQPWSHKEVGAGADWKNVIGEHLDSASVVLLLLSADFFASAQCMDADVERALARAHKARVIPIRVRAYDWGAVPFEHLQPLPRNGTPVDSWPKHDEAWAEVAAEIRRLVTLPARRIPAQATPHYLLPRRLFVGRKDELGRVDQALRIEGRTSIAQAAVWGLGGVGKSALALEYAYQALDAGTYPGGIFWVLAEGSPIGAMARLAGILRKHAPAIRLELPEHIPPAEVADAVKYALQDLTEPSLLVLDNVSEEWGAELLPGGQVRVLMTMRDRRLALGKAIPLDMLSLQDARTLAIDLAEKTPEDEDEEAALGRVLDKQLGGLAVAVEVAARAVKEWARSWVEYEKLLTKQPRDALDAKEDRSRNYEPGVFAALDLSIDRCGENARKLLEGAAVFAPDAVPLDWAYAAAGLDAEDIPAKRALGDLEALRLVKVADKAGALSMHRLVHKRVRDRVHVVAWTAASMRVVEPVKSWIKKAVGPAKEQMDAVEARRKHIMEALAAADRVGSMGEWCLIADQLATHLQYCGEYVEARSWFERALAISEKTYGPEHLNVAASLSNLAGVLLHAQEAAQAQPLQRRALAIYEKTYGLDHRYVAICLSNLAAALSRPSEAAQARPLMERALAINEKAYGPEHPEAAISLSNLASVLVDLREAAQARPLAERALAISEKTYGSEHPYVASRLSILASVLVDLGEPAQALPLADRAVAIGEKALPPAHPSLDTYRRGLAAVREALGEPPAPAG
jgi:tetratricopeptide (TPR) repeat protein